MAQSSFWTWQAYARANDDVRHHLIERGWFGQETPDNAMEQDVVGQQRLEAQDSMPEGNIWETGQDAERGDLYDHEPEQDVDPAEPLEQETQQEPQQER